MSTLHVAGTFADKIEMQHRLFAALSSMFGREVPLYDKALLVNAVSNRTACALLGQMYRGFGISDAQMEKTSGERHGAIRIGRPDEFRWIARFFAAFAMEPHNFNDMTNIGRKSQPIIATAFRSVEHPEHRVFTSLLMTNYFDPGLKARIDMVLEARQVFSDRARALVEKSEQEGGLTWEDAGELIAEATGRIFKWTGRARDHGLYKELCDTGFKIAADIACFERHHLNHLTPNTLCMDLYTSAMKHCLGELTVEEFKMRAVRALTHLVHAADRDWMHLHFKVMTRETIDGYPKIEPGPGAGAIAALVDAMAERLGERDLDLSGVQHSGHKDFTEGPSQDTPVLLRQDAYKAIPEAVEFVNADGTATKGVHTARFGEIEQRFYATTPAGRALYDNCLSLADAAREKDPGLPKRDFAAYEAMYAAPFAAIPKTLPELLERGLVYGVYSATPKGIEGKGSIRATEPNELVRLGYAQVEGLRYEDFLPVSAAGIFASNLNQYGTKSTAAEKPAYSKATLEEIMGKKIIDTNETYRGMEAASILRMYQDLGLESSVESGRLAELRRDAAFMPGSRGKLDACRAARV